MSIVEALGYAIGAYHVTWGLARLGTGVEAV